MIVGADGTGTTSYRQFINFHIMAKKTRTIWVSFVPLIKLLKYCLICWYWQENREFKINTLHITLLYREASILH